MQSSSDLRGKAAAVRETLRPRTAPQDTGRRLATLRRSESEEVRLSWNEYQGRPFLQLRLWTRDSSGQWWPSKDKGLSLKVRELPDLADGLAEALDLAAAARAASKDESAGRDNIRERIRQEQERGGTPRGGGPEQGRPDFSRDGGGLEHGPPF